MISEAIPVKAFDPKAKKKKKRLIPAIPTTNIESRAQDIDDISLEECVNEVLINKLKSTKLIPLKGLEVYKVSARMTAWVNFKETCQAIKRVPELLMLFLSRELNAEVILTTENCLIIEMRIRNELLTRLVARFISKC